MIIMAFNELDTPLQLFDAVIFEDVSSVFVTSSVLKLLQGIYHFSPIASGFDSKSLSSSLLQFPPAKKKKWTNELVFTGGSVTGNENEIVNHVTSFFSHYLIMIRGKIC